MANDSTTNDIDKMMEDNDVAHNNTNNSDSSDDDEQYETSYSKFTNKHNNTIPTNKQQRSVPRGRRRGGYGNSSMSILETLKPTGEGGDGATDDVVSSNHKYNATNNKNEEQQQEEDVSHESSDVFGLNMNDFISQEFIGSGDMQTDIFMNADSENEDDDDATHPYNVESDLEKIGPWTGDVESDDADDNDNDDVVNSTREEDEEEVQYHSSRGRTKQTKNVIATKSNDEDGEEDRGNKDSSDIEEEEEENVVDDDNVDSGEAAVDKVELGEEVDTSPNNNDNHPTKSIPTSTTTTEETSNNKNNEEPSNKDLLSLVDTLFTAANKDTMTVGDINKSVATNYGWVKVDKKRKKLIKKRLTDLMQGTVSVGEGLDDDDDEEEGEEGVESKKKEKKSSKKFKKKREKKNESSDIDDENMEDIFDDEEIVDGDDDDDDESYEEGRSTKKKKKKRTTTPRSSRRSKSKSGRGKMAKHIRDHHSKARLRQMEEARIREEELGHLADDDDDDDDEVAKKNDKEQDAAKPKVSNEDRQRAEEISARFNTNREELVVKRRDDRVGLIGRLRTARMEQLEENLTLSALAKDVEKADANVKVEESVEEGQPKLTFVPKLEKDDKAAMVDLDSSDDDEEGSDDDDDDLEIIAPSSKDEDAIISPKISKRKTSVVDLLINSNKTSVIRRDPQKNSMKSKADPRMIMRNALRAQKVAAGNKWLANQLEYKNEQDHIRDCLEAENKKRRQILLMEKKAAAREKEAASREEAIFTTINETNELEKEFAGDEKEFDGDEDDEEMAVARKLEQLERDEEEDQGEQDADRGDEEDREVEQAEDSQVDDNANTEINTDETNPNIDDDTEAETGAESSLSSMVVTPSKVNTEVVDTSKNLEEEKVVEEEIVADREITTDNNVAVEAETDSKKISDVDREEGMSDDVSEKKMDPKAGILEEQLDQGDKHIDDDDLTVNTSNDDAPPSPTKESEDKPGPKKPKNSAWQAMLLKEKASLAKQKRLKRKNGGLVEGEAEEEEEEDGIVGLEDFGFAVSTKKDDEDDVDADVDQDDLEHVVDELSDGEGDEEAGEIARKRLAQAEEKERHAELMRRMRDGYDGRRGGIASGTARGNHRFDQLVATDNREDAKRLGLLNDDELFDDENGGDNGDGSDKKKDDEEEDETALLDKMLKDRFLHKNEEDVFEENFTDDEESDDEADEVGEKKSNDENDDDKEQERIAKHFAKRARRNRILEEYEGQDEFSRSRLIDEDETTQKDLKMMKTSFFRKRSMEGSNLDMTKENNCSSKKPKCTTGADDTVQSASSFLAQEGSLSVALMASRSTISRKRKTTFLSGKTSSTFSRSYSSSSSSKSVSLNHVVFMAEEKSSSKQLLDSNSTSNHSFQRGQSKARATQKSGSLWSKVRASKFK